ncbi:hypothetical protein LINGRAHAP2_LOCUS11204 [Linum grandiflorum]
MTHYAIQQNAFSRRDEIRRSSTASPISDRKESVVCPKPRRFSLFSDTVNDHPVRSLRWQLSHQTETCDSIGGNDLLDIILTKGDYSGGGADQSYPQVASSPPFFSGSPPSRVANPLIQDARFGEEKLSPFSSISGVPPPSGLPSSPTSTTSTGRKGGCVRANFGDQPMVRVEGFDCLDRDSRNCSIPALA